MFLYNAEFPSGIEHDCFKQLFAFLFLCRQGHMILKQFPTKFEYFIIHSCNVVSKYYYIYITITIA